MKLSPADSFKEGDVVKRKKKLWSQKTSLWLNGIMNFALVSGNTKVQLWFHAGLHCSRTNFSGGPQSKVQLSSSGGVQRLPPAFPGYHCGVQGIWMEGASSPECFAVEPCTSPLLHLTGTVLLLSRDSALDWCGCYSYLQNFCSLIFLAAPFSIPSDLPMQCLSNGGSWWSH